MLTAKLSEFGLWEEEDTSALHLKQNLTASFSSHMWALIYFSFVDPFIKKTFAQCLLNGVKLLIVFTNWGRFIRIVSVEICPTIYIWYRHSVNYITFFWSLTIRCINFVAEPWAFFQIISFTEISFKYLHLKKKNVFLLLVTKPTREQFWWGSHNLPPSFHWCPCKTLKTHNASSLSVPGTLLRAHPICVNWIPSCSLHVVGHPESHYWNSGHRAS